MCRPRRSPGSECPRGLPHAGRLTIGALSSPKLSPPAFKLIASRQLCASACRLACGQWPSRSAGPQPLSELKPCRPGAGNRR
eukprot:13090556-Alexandrium_andersonii.AAC.1